MAFNSVQECLNQVATDFAEGHEWHRQAGLSALKNGYRGLRRWHYIESDSDRSNLVDFELYLMDNFRMEIVPDKAVINKAMDYKFEKSDLKTHLETWMDRERDLIGLLEDAIQYMSNQKYYSIYKMLGGYLAEVENELMYIKILADNLEFAKYGEHHVMVVMRWLHNYFENEYDGGRIDFCIE